ncbi:hypothetical protein [Paramagnetospirillum magnetotacticum]|uniref:hypothetical protein n=1 Tax=Paramagnetospirillum magnetotacticum TaxID=188 RepID=UPI001269EAFD|nr:hypothetical protein [Paramagnetospirillum magnetotacticum]
MGKNQDGECLKNKNFIEFDKLISDASASLKDSLQIWMPCVPAKRNGSNNITYNYIAERNITAHICRMAGAKGYNVYAEIPINGKDKIDIMLARGAEESYLIEAKRIYPRKESAKSIIADIGRMKNFKQSVVEFHGSLDATAPVIPDPIYGAIVAYTADAEVAKEWMGAPNVRPAKWMSLLLEMSNSGIRKAHELKLMQNNFQPYSNSWILVWVFPL